MQAVFTAPHMPLPAGVAGGRVAGRKRGGVPRRLGARAGVVPWAE